MTELGFKLDWVDLAGDDSPELLATYANLQISAGEDCITHVEDLKSKSVRDYITLPLYILAEWVVQQWWSLLDEPLVPQRDTNVEEFASRHLLSYAAEGFPLPQLSFQPQGEQTLLKWKPASPRYAKLRFIGDGAAMVQTGQAREALHDLVETTCARLCERGVNDTWCQREWQAIQSMPSDEASFCRAVGCHGLDPFQLAPATAQDIISICNLLHPVAGKELLQAAPNTCIKKTLHWLQKSITALTETQNHRMTIELEPGSYPSLHAKETPWGVGYDAARRIRHLLDLDDTGKLDVQSLFDGGSMPIHREPPPARSINGIIRITEGGLACSWPTRRVESQRFLLARSLGVALVDRTPDRCHVHTLAPTPLQQYSRAFAAELLAPRDLLRSRLGPGEVGEDEVQEVAEHFGVSTYVIEHQIQNHGLATLPSP